MKKQTAQQKRDAIYVKKQEREMKRILREIVRFLDKSEDYSQKLWNILTALRGPDTDILTTKEATTAIIRHKIGLRASCLGVIINSDSAKHLKTRIQQISYSNDTSHFIRHAKNAFDALGFKWNKVNK